MRILALILGFFLLTISVNAQNGVYDCGRQEYKALNPEENTEHRNNCTIIIQIYGVGGDDFVSAVIQSDNPEEDITYKWHIKSELQMSPDATGKKIFKSYVASLSSENSNATDEYQITVIKGVKSGKITVAAIDEEGSTHWFYELEKIK